MVIVYYLKDIYCLYKFVKIEGGNLISIDDSLFMPINGEKIWIIGTKNN